MQIDLDTAEYAVCLTAARDAEAERQFDAALLAWDKVRARFPQAAGGYSGAGLLLRDLGRYDEAERILTEGLEKAPGDQQTAAAQAWVAHSRGDFIEADRRWSMLRQNFPDCFDGYFGGGAVLCGLGQFDAADVVYRQALALFPVAAHLLSDFAAVAQTRGDRVEAERRWNALRTLFPGDFDGYLRQARALRQLGEWQGAEAVLREAQQRFPDNAAAMVDFAHVAAQRRDWPEALRRWDAVVSKFHGMLEGYVGAAGALNELGRFDDADTVLQPATRLFPHSVEVAALSAWIAHYRRDYEEAVKRWETLRHRFPQSFVGFTGGTNSLLAAGRVPEADALILAANQQFPHELDVALMYADVPHHLPPSDEALRRWTQVRERFSGAPGAVAGYARSLLRAGQIAEAEALLEASISEPGQDVELGRTYAECAVERRDWAAAEARWRVILDQHPTLVFSWIGLGEVLRAAGQFGAALAVLNEALARFPAHPELERHVATTLTAMREWPEALRRWDALRAKFPRDPAVRSGIRDALWHARQDLGVVESDGSAPAAHFEIPPGLLDANSSMADGLSERRDLLMRFESIGDTCEFGMVQRRFGAEPLGLLRWASTRPDDLVVALDNRLAGVGNAEYTVVEVSAGGEYTTMDKRYHMFSHTFTPETSEPIQKFTKQHLRRMQFLRRKLLDDLASGEKIFVYKCDQGLSETQEMELCRAIRGYGAAAALLCVRLQDAAHPAGTLLQNAPGSFSGYIDRFSTVDIHMDAWLDLCRKTAAQSASSTAAD